MSRDFQERWKFSYEWEECLSDIPSSHGGENDDGRSRGCYAVESCRNFRSVCCLHYQGKKVTEI